MGRIVSELLTNLAWFAPVFEAADLYYSRPGLHGWVVKRSGTTPLPTAPIPSDGWTVPFMEMLSEGEAETNLHSRRPDCDGAIPGNRISA
jgi:hypothetical protein